MHAALQVRIREDWFDLAPSGAKLNMRDWVLIGKMVKRRGIKRHDHDGVRRVVDEYLSNR